MQRGETLQKREDWLHLSRDLDWEFSYVSEAEVFPAAVSGSEHLSTKQWLDWEEPFKTTYSEYVVKQAEKEHSVQAVREAVGKVEDFQKLPKAWANGLKLHAAALPLAEFAAVVGNLRAARFAKNSSWRTAANFGALDEMRHTQIPLLLMHDLVRWDKQFDWTHKFYHTNNWVAIAARHLTDELLLMSNPVEFAIGTNFVFETGFTNLQFIGLSAMAHRTGDHMFEKMIKSIQTDEARHAQIGPAVLRKIAATDPKYAQFLLDKWFWRSWHLFAVLTGFSMDYLTPLEKRTHSFKEFMQEWVIEQYISSLQEFDLKKPWYWDFFLQSLDHYHHMVYAAAYTYRSTVWFDLVVPSPAEREWLMEKYPDSWPTLRPVWDNIDKRWEKCDVGIDFGVHGTAIVTFCDTCQFVLCEGTPTENQARTKVFGDKKYIFCSEPCERIFRDEQLRYGEHKDVVKRVLAGDAPGNVLALITQYFQLTEEVWGRDAFGGNYPWIKRLAKESRSVQEEIR